MTREATLSHLIKERNRTEAEFREAAAELDAFMTAEAWHQAHLRRETCEGIQVTPRHELPGRVRKYLP